MQNPIIPILALLVALAALVVSLSPQLGAPELLAHANESTELRSQIAALRERVDALEQEVKSTSALANKTHGNLSLLTQTTQRAFDEVGAALANLKPESKDQPVEAQKPTAPSATAAAGVRRSP